VIGIDLTLDNNLTRSKKQIKIYGVDSLLPRVEAAVEMQMMMNGLFGLTECNKIIVLMDLANRTLRLLHFTVV
jgi:hypothetical protein